MTHCPRCRHPVTAPVPTVCTQCGATVPVGEPVPSSTSPVKLILGVIAVVLVVILLGVAFSYLQDVNRLVK